MQLAKRHRAEGFCYTAEDLYKQSIAIARVLNRPEPSCLTEALYELATYYDLQGKENEAEPLWIELKTYEPFFSSSNYIYVDTVYHLAHLSEKKNAFAVAEVLYKKLLKKQESEFGDESLEICPVIEKLAAFYTRQGKYSLAESLNLRILGIKEFYLGTCSPEINSTVNSLIEIFLKLNKPRLAEYMMNRQKGILLALHGKESICVATCALRLAELQASQNQKNKAIDNLSYAVHVYRNQFGENSNVVKSLHEKLDTMLISGLETSFAPFENEIEAEHLDKGNLSNSECNIPVVPVLAIV